MGCGLIFAEMVGDKAILMVIKNNWYIIYDRLWTSIAQQIFGSDKDSFVKAAKFIYEKMKPDIIDINMGCPMPQ